MILKKWEQIPDSIKNEETYKYYQELEKRRFSLLLKRIFDIFFSFALLIILSPIFIILAVLIKIDSKGPIFFKQERVTEYGKIFKILKFRTMFQDLDKAGSLITTSNDLRITKIGKLIRKCRLDEIPQLINILKGEMSFIGTRPEVKKYVDEYTDEMKATLLMKAGLTSLASIKYKDEGIIIEKYLAEGKTIDDIYINKIMPEKMKYNLEYIEKFSLLKDLKLILNTVFSVLKK